MRDMDSKNLYEDEKRAEAYAQLEFKGTYYLAYRDLPKIFHEHAKGNNALDFGCGTGRSTRFLKENGFTVTGVDISPEMIAKAKIADPTGDYRLIPNDDFSKLPTNHYDLILCAFPFDNIAGPMKVKLFREMRELVNKEGILVNVVSSPDLYTHEWTSFTSKEFTENRNAKNGDIVKVVVMDIDDRRPFDDVFWNDEAYRDVYQQAGLQLTATYRPLGKPEDPYTWVIETRVAPWVIYVLKK